MYGTLDGVTRDRLSIAANTTDRSICSGCEHDAVAAGGFARLFQTHPPVEERIAGLLSRSAGARTALR